MADYLTQIKVLKNGKGVRCSVRLYISGGLIAYENTGTVKTDNNGIARIPHQKKGKAKVYIDGHHRNTTTGSEFSAPDEVTVYLDFA